MRPDDNGLPANNPPGTQNRSLPPVSAAPGDNQAAAANLVRDKIDAIYGGETVASSHRDDYAPAQAPLTIENPYERTHTRTIHPQADQWQKYHNAWQNYYQRYYERYYINQVHEATRQLQEQIAHPEGAQDQSGPTVIGSAKKGIDREEALRDLRARLLRKVRGTTGKARSSRHFAPIMAAVVIMLIVVLLQYNRAIAAAFVAYTSPGSISPQNIIVDPSTLKAVGPEPKLIIPKINVDVPVIYGVGPDHDSQMKAMESGVAHFAIPGASSIPGQVGNTVISGHSSNDLFDGGDYKFIFAQLEKLAAGDIIYANYEGVRYTYTVTKMEVVMPTEVSKLIYDTDKPVLTLITCTPLGTANKRLLVTAEQISPDPTAAATAPDTTGSTSVTIPGTSPTLFERLFR